jgi:hypothetical protein
MQVEKNKRFIKNLALVGGIIEIFFAGFVNSMYSASRWPTRSGIQALTDFIYYSYSNPYALLSGVLFYLFFYRISDKLEDLQMGKKGYHFHSNWSMFNNLDLYYIRRRPRLLNVVRYDLKNM